MFSESEGKWVVMTSVIFTKHQRKPSLLLYNSPPLESSFALVCAKASVSRAAERVASLAAPSICASSSSRFSPSNFSTWVRVRPSSSSLTTRRWASPKAASCGRWVTHSTWCRRPRLQASRHHEAHPPANALVDLVEDQGGDGIRPGQHVLEGQHQARGFAAGGDLDQRFSPSPGLGAIRNSTWSSPFVEGHTAAHPTGTPCGIRLGLEIDAEARARPCAGRPARLRWPLPATRPACWRDSAERRARPGQLLPAARFSAFQLRDALAGMGDCLQLVRAFSA